jgi:hypothetical protein
MEQPDKNVIIELSLWEAQQLNEGLKYLIDCHVCNPEVVKRIPEPSLKAVSWCIAFRVNKLGKVFHIGKSVIHTR